MSTSSTDGRLLADDDRDRLRGSWTRITERFVDDPAAAVRDADALIEQTIDQIRASLDDRRSTTRAAWTELDGATTEQLREALHRYEVLFGQLTDAPAPTAWRERHD